MKLNFTEVEIKYILLTVGALATLIGIIASIYKIREARYKIRESKRNLSASKNQHSTGPSRSPAITSGIEYEIPKNKDELKELKNKIPKAEYKFLKKKLKD